MAPLPNGRPRVSGLTGLILTFVLIAAGPVLAADPPPDPVPTLSEEMTVTATRTERRLGDTAASVAVLSAQELAASAAPTVDDALRQVPGFSLFRRSGSRFANPTTQGVSLRGLGASGASRALVLADGIPLNDPFGGWIAWGRVPRAALERIEVLRGAGSDLYGSTALGGVVQLLRRPARGSADGPVIVADGSAGQLHSADGSLFAAGTWKGWGASVAAESSRTDGYVLVDPAVRGLVDTPAGSRHNTFEGTVERGTAAGGRLFVRGSRYTEDRTNGTPLQTNDSDFRQWSAGGDSPAGGGFLSVRGWGGDQEYHQGFTSVAADRASERLLRSQSVPADTAGGSIQWSHPVTDLHALVGGVELRQVHGSSDETVFGNGPPTLVSVGGRQRTGGLYLEDVARLSPRLSLTVGGRYDSWTNDGVKRSGTAPETRLPRRDETAFSPRASLLFQATESWAWTASAYKAFRAPTLNELYRAFRVGNVQTLANQDLRAERLTGGETGLLFTGHGGRGVRIEARETLFWMDIDQTIANVTLSVTPGLITRQRQNLGSTRSRGIETEITARAGDRWTLTGGWLLSDARVVTAPAERDLEGLRLSQVPRNQATLQVRFDDPRFATVALQARWTGAQFDDDQNQFLLRSFTSVDALVSRSLGTWLRGLAIFAAGENLANTSYDIGRTPLRTLGAPRTLRVGFRVER
jgi:outer membrane receptor protein involved in Fe transport